MVSGPDEENRTTVVGCGPSLPGQELVIVDPARTWTSELPRAIPIATDSPATSPPDGTAATT